MQRAAEEDEEDSDGEDESKEEKENITYSYMLFPSQRKFGGEEYPAEDALWCLGLCGVRDCVRSWSGPSAAYWKHILDGVDVATRVSSVRLLSCTRIDHPVCDRPVPSKVVSSEVVVYRPRQLKCILECRYANRLEETRTR